MEIFLKRNHRLVDRAIDGLATPMVRPSLGYFRHNAGEEPLDVSTTTESLKE